MASQTDSKGDTRSRDEQQKEPKQQQQQQQQQPCQHSSDTSSPEQPDPGENEPEFSCHVCTRIVNQGKRPQRPGNIIVRCLLCNRDFCESHESRPAGSGGGGDDDDDDDDDEDTASPSVCEINHRTYYRRHPALHGTVWPTLEARRAGSERGRRAGSSGGA